jgi:hypothetical protein
MVILDGGVTLPACSAVTLRVMARRGRFSPVRQSRPLLTHRTRKHRRLLILPQNLYPNLHRNLTRHAEKKIWLVDLAGKLLMGNA